MKLSKPELIAILLYVPGRTGKIDEPVVGRTRLMKILFLLMKEAGLESEVEQSSSFKPYKFGPFDPEVFDSIEALKELNVVEETSKSNTKAEDEILADVDEPYDTDTAYTLTPQGTAKVERIVRQIPADILKKISNYKSIYGSKPLVEILHYVYGKFPKYAEMSEANI
jgi:uncharacterized protein YwgA